MKNIGYSASTGSGGADFQMARTKSASGSALQRGFVGQAGGLQDLGERLVGQLMAPDVAVAPDDIGLGGVAGDDHRLDARRGGDQRFGNGDADARRGARIDVAGLAQFGERPADAAHDVAALDGDFAGERRGDGVGNRRGQWRAVRPRSAAPRRSRSRSSATCTGT